MPKLKEGQLPSYRLHKQSGQAIVTLSGKDILLGTYGTPASRATYRRVTSEWLAGQGVVKPATAGADVTVAELVLAFWRWAKTYYRRPDGKPTTEVSNLKSVLRLVRRTYGSTRAADFGPRALKALIAEMIRRGWCRTNINRQIARIKMLFKWAVSNELVPASVHHALVTVAGVRRGRTEARESAPVKPVPDEPVDAIQPFVSAQVWTMIELQRLTGMRPAEVCTMRGCDIDTMGKIWQYAPASHKTAHHGHDRKIYLGPRARALVTPYLRPNTQAYLFSPTAAEIARRAKLHTERKTPLNQGNAPGRNRRRRPARTPQEHYTVASYRRAIQRACEKAFGMPAELREPESKSAVEADTPEAKKLRRQRRANWHAQHSWHPHQLRHSAATRLRKEYGIEAAQVILGHKTLNVTEIYAEKNVEAARRIMAEVG